MEVKCTFCGGKQVIAKSSKCSFCQNFIDIEVSGNFHKVSLAGDLGNLVLMAQTALDVRNWEEAVLYFNKILEKDIQNSDAWFGKGISTLNGSTLTNIKVNQAITYFEKSIKYANNPKAMRKRIAKEINDSIILFYLSIESHFIRFMSLDHSYIDFLSRFFILETALNYASDLDPSSIKILENALDLCERVYPTSFLKNKFINFSKAGKDNFAEWNSPIYLDLLNDLRQKYLEKIIKIKPKKIFNLNNKDTLQIKEKHTLLIGGFLGKSPKFGFVKRFF